MSTTAIPNENESRVTPRPFREEQAWREIGHTEFTPGVRWTLTIVFCLFMVSVPLMQFSMDEHIYGALLRSDAKEVSGWEGPTLKATIKQISAPPDASGVYNDFVMQCIVRLDEGSEKLLAMLGMRNRVVLPAASMRPGDRVELGLQAWSAVAEQFSGMNGSVLEDQKYDTMEREFAAHIISEAGPQLAHGTDFLEVWAGVGDALPIEHRQGVFRSMTQAWQDGDDLLDGFLAANSYLSKRVDLYETALNDAAIPALLLRSPVQGLMTAVGVGNEQAYVGLDGWLFFTPGVQALTGKGFLDPAQIHRRTRTSKEQPDPRKAILDFKEQLSARGIELVLMPTPVKPSIYPEQLSSRYDDNTLTRNRSMAAFLDEMKSAGVNVYDPSALLLQAKGSGQQFLSTDTHWTPAGMQAVAADLTTLLKTKVTSGSKTYTTKESTHTQFGDIATMLNLPDWQASVAEETVVVEQVVNHNGKLWQPQAKSEVMLLGDSFTNIFHLGAMGWGEGAGFAEHLSHQLQAPLDLLAKNDAGAHASRQLLVDALKRNPQRLHGKKVLIWEFAERELAVGDWKVLSLPPQPEVPVGNDALLFPPIADATAAEQAFKKLADKLNDENKPVIEGRDGWLHLRSELRHLGAGVFWGEDKGVNDPLASLVDLKTKLDDLGVQLILAPVPPRAVIYPDTVFGGVPMNDGIPQRLDINLQSFYAALRQKGVTVVDVTAAFLEARKEDADLGPVCCPQDTHWSPRGLQIAAAAIAEQIGTPDWLAEMQEEFYAQAPEALNYTGDLVERIEGFESEGSQATIVKITTDEKGNTPIPFNVDSPVLLLADSHGLVFSVGKDMHCEAAGLGEHIANKLGIQIDRMAQRGSGDTVRRDLARRFILNPDEAAKKRVLIYTFAARTFSEFKSWKPVPLKR